MSSVQAMVEQLPDYTEGGPDYTDTPPADGRGPTISCDRGCYFPSSRTDELLRLPTRARAMPAGPAHHLLTLDLARVFRRP